MIQLLRKLKLLIVMCPMSELELGFHRPFMTTDMFLLSDLFSFMTYHMVCY